MDLALSKRIKRLRFHLEIAFEVRPFRKRVQCARLNAMTSRRLSPTGTTLRPDVKSEMRLEFGHCRPSTGSALSASGTIQA